MPELPEVQTTVGGLQKTIIGLRVIDAWSNYNSNYFKGSKTIKDLAYFKIFKKMVTGTKIIAVERRAKNILIHLNNNNTIIIHMKMTGHVLYGKFSFEPKHSKDPWIGIAPPGLRDPFNRHIRFVLSFSNGKFLALSDIRRFAKVALHDSATIHISPHLHKIGPEPLEKAFTFKKFNERIDMRPKGKIKQVLLDQEIIAGIGNIYADESLWRTTIHPARAVKDVSNIERRNLYTAIKKNLARGIDFGGDSMSDYRNVHGEKGRFQEQHFAYRKTGTKCQRKRCLGTITRIVIGSRGTHFCNTHQK